MDLSPITVKMKKKKKTLKEQVDELTILVSQMEIKLSQRDDEIQALQRENHEKNEKIHSLETSLNDSQVSLNLISSPLTKRSPSGNTDISTDILRDFHKKDKQAQKKDLLIHWESIRPGNMSVWKRKFKIFSSTDDGIVQYTYQHSKDQYTIEENLKGFSETELSLLKISQNKKLAFHSKEKSPLGVQKNQFIIYAAVIQYTDPNDLQHERIYVGKAKNVKTRWGLSTTNHLGVIRDLIEKKKRMGENIQLVDLSMALIGKDHSIRLFLIDQAANSDDLRDLERKYIGNWNWNGKMINLESHPYGLNMSSSGKSEIHSDVEETDLEEE
jgi:hypothetical protein